MPTSQAFGREIYRVETESLLVTETVHQAGLRLPKHAHASGCFHFVVEGTYCENTRAGSVALRAGGLIFKPAGEVHWNHFSPGEARTLRFELRSGLREGAGIPTEPAQSMDPSLTLLAARIRRELRAPDDLSTMAVEGLALELVVQAARNQSAQAPPGRLAIAGAAAEILRSNFRRTQTLSQIADELQCHRCSLSRAFRQTYGCTMTDYVQRLRVARVIERMGASDEPLTEIALEAGFADHSHCSRVFRRLTGLAPSRWRRRHH